MVRCARMILCLPNSNLNDSGSEATQAYLLNFHFIDSEYGYLKDLSLFTATSAGKFNNFFIGFKFRSTVLQNGGSSEGCDGRGIAYGMG